MTDDVKTDDFGERCTEQMSDVEALRIRNLLKPDDSYDNDGTYWADLSFKDRYSFVSRVNSTESKRERAIIWAMFKEDPLSPLMWWTKNCAIPGAGIFLEGYVLFSIGNIKPLLQASYPSCWAEYETCSKKWVEAIEYLTILGIILGQLSVGYIGDTIGRRWGMTQDVCIMFIALILLTSAWSKDLNGWVIFYGFGLFIYGIGAGGEYPMTSTAGMENIPPTRAGQRQDRLHRGRNILRTFTMQGLGSLTNQIMLIVLLLISDDNRGRPPYSQAASQITYRVSFVFAALLAFWLVYYRVWHMKFGPRKAEGAVSGYSKKSIGLSFKFYGSRLFATCSAWYLNDLFYFGNKLFQNQFIEVLTPGNKSVLVAWRWNLLNIAVAICGYVAATFLVDHKLYGRKWMMTLGFLFDFVLFAAPCFDYEYFNSSAGIKAFQFCYFLSGFFAQFGPNCVIFLAAAEVYPQNIRATAHGISAASGKMGALTAAVLFNFINTREKFWFIPWIGLVGAISTFVFLPDTTGLDLKEGERRWEFICAGRSEDYHGVAIHPKHLSLWERWRGVGKFYDAKVDYEQRINELGTEWEKAQRGNELDPERLETIAEEWEREIHEYFHRTRKADSVSRSSQQISSEKI